MTPRQASNVFRKFAQDLDALDRDASNLAETVATKTANKFSSGSVPTVQMRRPVSVGGLAHPYGYGPVGAAGKRGRVPYGDSAVINAQGGAFRAYWGIQRSGRAFRQVNRAEYALYLFEGTRTMVPRPIDYRIAFQVEKDLTRFVDKRLARIIPK